MKLIKNLLQFLLGTFLAYAGTTHLGSNRTEFQAQVPTWLPLNADFVVVASGLVEITLGICLIITTFIFMHLRQKVGIVVAIFFVLIFPGNFNQYINGIDAFGLDTDQKRLIRLFFQPLLVMWAIWSTGVVLRKKVK